jgi:site-specific recombinase XerD
MMTTLRGEKGLARLTVEAYRSDLAQLSVFLGGQELLTSQYEDLRSFVGQLLSTVALSAARKIVTLRQFFKFLAMDGLVVRDPHAADRIT